MKFRTYGMILFFVLGLVFSFTIEASASHDDGQSRTAADVELGNEQHMKELIKHIVVHYNQIRDPFIGDDFEERRVELYKELTIFAREIRREDGDYRHGEVYAMQITDNLVITNHARYPELINYKINPDAGTQLAEIFKALLENSDTGATNCEDYGENNERVVCAEKVESGLGGENLTIIAGLHHEGDLDNLDAVFKEPDCSGLTLETTAENVFEDPSDANLVAFVKDVIETIQEDVGRLAVEEIGKLDGVDLTNLVTLAKLADPTTIAELNRAITARIQERLFCFGRGDFKHENIYVFIMDTDLTESTVLVNGNNFDLNGANLELEDDLLSGEQNIARLFNNALGGEAVGNSAYVDYHWDDPTDPDDDVPNFFEDRKVPGTTPKRSYIEVADLNGGVPKAVAAATGGLLQESQVPSSVGLFIFGSGIYNPPEMTPEETTSGGGGGCAIAGASNRSQAALLSLLLTASAFFSVVFLRRHA